MTKQKNRLWILPIVLVLLLVGSYCLLRFVFFIDLFDTSTQEESSTILPSEPTEPQSPWQTIDGNVYYSDPATGNKVTGWLELDGKQYCFGENGAMLTGWQTLDDCRYLFDAEGIMVTGWHTEGTNSFFLDADGKLHTGWLDWESKRYYFNEDGLMQTGWLTWENDRYYLHTDGHMAKGEVILDGISHFFTSTGKYVLLVNPWHAIPEDYVFNLVDAGGYQFDASGAEALLRMVEDCRAAGFDCYINNTFRTRATQQYLWDHGIEKRMAKGMTYEEALADTARSVAIPGHSEHETGLAVDLSGNDAMDAWTGEHCWEYGFILRYPDNLVHVTGIKYEPWHFRYVGTELALELKELGLCLEDYMTLLTMQESA